MVEGCAVLDEDIFMLPTLPTRPASTVSRKLLADPTMFADRALPDTTVRLCILGVDMSPARPPLEAGHEVEDEVAHDPHGRCRPTEPSVPRLAPSVPSLPLPFFQDVWLGASSGKEERLQAKHHKKKACQQYVPIGRCQVLLLRKLVLNHIAVGQYGQEASAEMAQATTEVIWRNAQTAETHGVHHEDHHQHAVEVVGRIALHVYQHRGVGSLGHEVEVAVAVAHVQHAWLLLRGFRV